MPRQALLGWAYPDPSYKLPPLGCTEKMALGRCRWSCRETGRASGKAARQGFPCALSSLPLLELLSQALLL